jgi:hypothetical protein
MLLLLATFAGSVSAELPGSGWWTSFTVQNLDASASATVEATAYQLQGVSGGPYTFSDSVDPQANKVYHPAFCGGSTLFPCFDPDLPSGFSGSVVLSSNASVAAVVQVGNNSQGSVGTSGGTASAQYNGKGSGSATLGYPIVKHNFNNKTTTFFIQAAGSAASVTATYNMADGSQKTDGPHAIDAGKTYVFDPAAAGVASSDCGTASTSPCVGAVTFTSTSGDIVGSVVEHEHSASPGKKAQSTAVFANTDGQATIYCPVYKNAYPASNPRTTGITVQNVGDSATDITVTAAGSNGTGAGQSYNSSVSDLGAGKSVVFYPASNNIGAFPSGTYGAVTISGGTGSQLVASVNEAGSDRETAFGCFSAEGATSKVSLPLHKEAFGGSGSNNRTGIAVQNVGSASTNVTATFVCNTGTFTHNSVSIAAGESYAYFLPSNKADNWSGTAMSAPALCAVTLEASSGGSIVAIGQESPSPGTDTDLDFKNYEGFNIN